MTRDPSNVSIRVISNPIPIPRGLVAAKITPHNADLSGRNGHCDNLRPKLNAITIL